MLKIRNIYQPKLLELEVHSGVESLVPDLWCWFLFSFYMFFNYLKSAASFLPCFMQAKLLCSQGSILAGACEKFGFISLMLKGLYREICF